MITVHTFDYINSFIGAITSAVLLPSLLGSITTNTSESLRLLRSSSTHYHLLVFLEEVENPIHQQTSHYVEHIQVFWESTTALDPSSLCSSG